MRILVTGGAGYVGSHVVRCLLSAGHTVVVVDNLSTGHREAVAGALLEVADFADRNTLARLGEAEPFGAVIHLAAHALVGESVAEPARYYRNNLIRSLEFLEWVRQAGWGGIVFSSSAAVYGEPETLPISEDHPVRPRNPYGETKLGFERALAAYQAAYGLPYVSLRYFNAAGADPGGELGEDRGRGETHLIPRLLEAALDPERTVEIYGTDYPTSDGTAVRDYVHVSDLAGAHVQALNRLAERASGIYNLGNGEGFSVREVVSICLEVSRRPIRTRECGRRPGDPAILVASSAKAREELSWAPRFSSLRGIVKSAWAWRESHPRGYAT
ncbi:MAG: UDP-glucose 4-epimerase GalE [Acidobacteriota bacterium]